MKILTLLKTLSAATMLASLTACAASAAQQGRYILYADPACTEQLKSPQGQTTVLTQWGQRLNGQVHLERQLATGGWVVTVTTPDTSADQQMKAMQSLPGLESVERDAILRHQ